MSSNIVHTEFTDRGYGKDSVRLLVLTRDGKIHYIKEVTVNTELTLHTVRDFVHADNSDVIATDSQKNTVNILARKFGIKSIEEFGLLLCEHFLTKYPQVIKTRMYIEEAPWKRIEIAGTKHIHGFLNNHEATRFCEVMRPRDEDPVVMAGLKDMKIMKTTQSAFKGFVDDEYRTLPYADDRIFCTIVQAKWWYGTIPDANFDSTWKEVKNIITKNFVGLPDEGVFSPCVQTTLYLTARNVLAQIHPIEKVEMVLPNVHHFKFDFSRFRDIEFENCNNEVYVPSDKPSGKIRASIQRKGVSRL